MGDLIFCTVCILLIGTLAGWVGHWALHQPWAKSLYHGHLVHHTLYTPKDYTSDTYRDAGSSDSAFVLGPLVAMVVGLFCLLLFSFDVAWYVYVSVVVSAIIVGGAHEYVHRAFHLKHHWLMRFRWFWRLRKIHLEHHRDPSKNLGIVWYGWDRAFRTFKS